MKSDTGDDFIKFDFVCDKKTNLIAYFGSRVVFNPSTKKPLR
jgi:hypothetical protein